MSLPDPAQFAPGYQIDIQYVEDGITKRVRAFANTINWLRVDGQGVFGASSDEPSVTIPINFVPPGVTGGTLVGLALTANTGNWSGSPTFAYQWLADNVPIAGATTNTHVLTLADLGKAMRIRITASNSAGSATAFSIPTIPVTSADPPVIPGNTGLPQITGEPVVGQTLIGDVGSWTGFPEPTYTYQWLANGSAIVGEVGQFLLLTSDQLGATISLEVTATNLAGSATAASAATEAVTTTEVPSDILPANTVLPSLTGTPQIGQTLTLDLGSWDGSPAPTFTQQWYADGFSIPSAVNTTFVVTEDQRAKRINCIVTATNRAGAALAASATGTIVTGVETTVKRYIRRSASGLGNGTSWADAGSLSSLNAFITAAGAHGQVLIRADEGSYTASTITLTAGGPVGQPVIVRGCDVNENPQNAILLGTRSSPWTAGSTTGPEVFRLTAGVHDVVFRSLEFQRCGNGCFRIGDNIDSLTIEQCVATNVQRFIENNISGTAVTAILTNSRILHCTARGFSRAFARMRYDAHDNLFEDCLGDSEGQDGDNFSAGITHESTGHNIILRRCTMMNCIDTQGGNQSNYWNADGFSQENGNFGMQYIDCIAKGCTDGGFDLKGSAIVLRGVSKENKKNYRVWGPTVLTDCISLDPILRGGTSTASHVSVHSDDGFASLVGCACADTRDATACFAIDEITGRITLTATSLQRSAGSTLLKNDSGAPVDITPLPAPAMTGAPLLTGNPVAGSTLACNTGSWAEGPLTFTYQWCRNDLYIDGGTSATYALVQADVDNFITCRVYPLTVAGAIGEGISNSTAAILPLAPSNTVAPSITGVTAVGSTLSVNTGTWVGLPTPTFTYQWLADGVDIGGAINATFLLTSGQLGAGVTVRVTGTNAAGAASAVSAATPAIGASIASLFVAPTAAGLKNGSSFANAIALVSLGSSITAMAADGIVNVAAHLGDYSFTSSVNITHGGTSGHPIIIRGVDASLAPMKATIIGSRTDWTLPANSETSTNVGSWTTGNELFRLGSGASHLTFRHFFAKRVGKFWNCSIAAISGITVEDCEFYNVQDGFYSNNFTVTDVVIRRYKGIGFSKRGIRCYSDSHDWLIEDFELNSGRQDRDDFAVGISLDDTAHDVVIRGRIEDGGGNNIGTYSGIIENCHDTGGDYWNGDGISAERGNHDFLIENITSRGHTDGGIDSKGTNSTFRNCHCQDSKKNFRLWGYTGVRLENCTSIDPAKRGGSSSSSHIYFNGSDARSNLLSPDITLEGVTIQSNPGNGAAAFGFADPVIYNIIVRDIATDYIGVSEPGTDLVGNSRRLRDTLDNVTPAVISTSAGLDTFNGKVFSSLLTADKDVTWRISGGADQAQFSVVDSAGVANQCGETLKMVKKVFIPAGQNDYAVQIEAKDANSNVATKTITVTVLEARPPETFLSNFEGPNNATTTIQDEAGGKDIVFSAGAKISTIAPLAGASSLSLGGGAQRCIVADHADFAFGSNTPFSIEALIKPILVPSSGANSIMSQSISTGNQRSFRFALATGGALDFLWSSNGASSGLDNLRSAIGVVVAGNTHRVLVDRDELNTVRIYVDGVMVASRTGVTTIFNSTASISIGNTGSTLTEGFIGLIDVLRVWKGYALCGDDAGYTPS